MEVTAELSEFPFDVSVELVGPRRQTEQGEGHVSLPKINWGKD
jgi:hypothetical protein